MINSYIFVFESMSSIYAYLPNLYFFLPVALAQAHLLVGRKGEKAPNRVLHGCSARAAPPAAAPRRRRARCSRPRPEGVWGRAV